MSLCSYGRDSESNTVASANTAVGYQALESFTTGPYGPATGRCLHGCRLSSARRILIPRRVDSPTVTLVIERSLAILTAFLTRRGVSLRSFTNAIGVGNTAVGSGALSLNTTCTEYGIWSLRLNPMTTALNTAVGENALRRQHDREQQHGHWQFCAPKQHVGTLILPWEPQPAKSHNGQ